MTSTILPAAGVAPLFTQQGVGTSPGYAALDDRRAVSGSLQEGVYGTSTLVTAGGVSNVGQADFMVTQNGSGANMSVDINMPAGGFAEVQGDTLSGQGLYCVPVHSTNINELIAAADATNPRVDQVILEVQDNVLDASGGNQARTRVLTGTPTGGASLTNRSGALALPGSALLLADVLVPNSSASVPNANIRDRRKWARGAFVRIVGAGAGDYTTSSSTMALIDSTALQPRVECSGLPLRLTLRCNHMNATQGNANVFSPFVDGAQPDSVSDYRTVHAPGAGFLIEGEFVYELFPSAGSHRLGWAWRSPSSTLATAKATVAVPLFMTVEEIARSNSANNVVTTG